MVRLNFRYKTTLVKFYLFLDLICGILVLVLQVTLLTKVVDEINQLIKRILFITTSIRNHTDRELDAELTLFTNQLYHQPLTLSAAGYMTIDFEFVQSVSVLASTCFTYFFLLSLLKTCNYCYLLLDDCRHYDALNYCDPVYAST